MEREFVIAKLLEAAEMVNERLDVDGAKRILAISQIQTFSKGDTILGINEKITSIGFVLEGIVRSYYLDMDGNDITRNFHSEHYSVMDEGLIGYDKSLCAYEAIEDSIIMLIDVKCLKDLIRKSENLKDVYIAALESGIQYKLYRENEFLMSNATERYLRFKKDFPELIGRVKQTYISTYLGITPESLSRIRKCLKEMLDE